MDRCGGCNVILDVTKPIVGHERYGILCPGCARFAADCEAEIAKLRQFAECLAVLEVLMTPPGLVN